MRRRQILESPLLLPWRIASAAQRRDSMGEAFAALERQAGGRLGVAVLDARTGKTSGNRRHERFAMCSTFKLVAAAAVLRRVDRGEDRLSRFIQYSERDLLEYAPVTRAHVSEGGMSLGDLCAAAVGLSDNTAGNLILATLGGPAGLTRFCRSLGARFTRLDRAEPELNRVAPGDPRDTTTPAEMLGLMKATLLGATTLSGDSRRRLEKCLIDATVGADRILAGLPQGWRAGHKTGTGPRGETNDIAIAWPGATSPPILVAAFYSGPDAPLARGSAVLASVGHIVGSFVGSRSHER